MSDRTQDNYEVPADLRFSTRDIVEMCGLRCSRKLDPAAFKGIYQPPDRLTEISARVEFFVGSDEILAQGAASGRAVLRCHNCLREFESSVSAEFEETFSTQAEFIDIMETVRQALVLSPEIRQLCRDGCKGLCCVCGADLNKGSCGCAKPERSPFSILKRKDGCKENKNRNP